MRPKSLHFKVGAWVFALAIVLGDSSSYSQNPAQCLLRTDFRLEASNPEDDDRFGWAVSISGNTAVIAAAFSDVNNEQTGCIYVFERSNVQWLQEAILIGSHVNGNDLFGYRVAISGDTIIVGAPQAGIGNSESGAAYVFVRSQGQWIEQAMLTATDADQGDHFGWSVALDGNTAIIGARRDDVPSQSNTGSAYAFLRSGSSWVQQAKLIGQGSGTSDQVGAAVAISENTAVIGAPYDNLPGPNSGSAYVFVRGGSIWSQQAQLQATGATPDEHFGFSVSIDSDRIAVGTVRINHTGTIPGAAYLFTRVNGLWTQEARLAPENSTPDDNFGSSLSLKGDRLLIGAYDADGSGSHSGTVHLYERIEGIWTESIRFRAIDVSPSDPWEYFGFSVCLEGSNAIIGVSSGDGSILDCGTAYIVDLDWDSDANGVIDQCDLGEQDCNINGILDVSEATLDHVIDFVSQLLLNHQDPMIVCIFDQNFDARLDGKDIQPYVASLLQ